MRKEIPLDDMRTALDQMNDGKPTDFEQTLRDGARELFQDHPEISQEEWILQLIKLFPCEVIDCFGPNEKEVRAALAELWEQEARL